MRRLRRRRQAAPSPLKGLKPEDLDMKDGNVIRQIRSEQSRSARQGRRAGSFVRDLLGQASDGSLGHGMGK